MQWEHQIPVKNLHDSSDDCHQSTMNHLQSIIFILIVLLINSTCMSKPETNGKSKISEMLCKFNHIRNKTSANQETGAFRRLYKNKSALNCMSFYEKFIPMPLVKSIIAFSFYCSINTKIGLNGFKIQPWFPRYRHWYISIFIYDKTLICIYMIL